MKEKGAGNVPAPESPEQKKSGCDFLIRVAQHITASPDCFDVMLAIAGDGQLFAQLANENVDNFQFRLVHAAVEVVEEHLLGQGCPLPQREQLEHLIFLAGQMHTLSVDLYRFGIEVHRKLAGGD